MMTKKQLVTLETILKILWVVGVLFSIYVLAWLVFFSFELLGSYSRIELTFLNYILPNIVNVILLIVYTRELIIGYRPVSQQRNLMSLAFLVVVVVLLIVVQLDDFKWYIESASDDFAIVIPLLMIATSMVGLLSNRAMNIKNSEVPMS